MKFKKYLRRKALISKFNSKQSNSFTVGTDGITVSKFKTILDEEITIIKRKVSNLSYKVSTYNEKLILKNRDSKPRMISIPTHRDKLTFSALTSFLTQNFEKKLPIKRTIHYKVVDIKNTVKSNKFDSFIKLDIENFYPSVNHDILLKKVSNVINDDMALSLLKKAITTHTFGKGRRTLKGIEEINTGIPQGLSFSNILSDIYFSAFDKKYLDRPDMSYYRFVDDILILCNKENINVIKEKLVKDIKKLKLKSHVFEKDSEKSSSGKVASDTFNYLGYQFTNNMVSVRESSVDRLKDNIIKMFYQYKNDQDLLYNKLNLKITGCVYDGKRYGWMSFFALSNDMKLLYHLDSFIKKCFFRFKIEYKETKIKKFAKTYFELKNIETTTYIPKFDNTVNLNLDGLTEDVEFY